MRYTVLVHYGSAWGVLTRGSIVELDEDTAAWLLRDAPGCIEPYVEPKPEPKPEPKERAFTAPIQHRRVTAPPVKREASGDGS